MYLKESGLRFDYFHYVQFQRPVINNLPASVSISEDTQYALIFTIDATDTVTSPVPCSLQTGDTTRFNVANIPSTTCKCICNI